MSTTAPSDNDGIDTSPFVADTVKTTTCYMCACRCGIRVFLKDGQIRYIQGNRDHPVNKGVLCGKGAAGIMNHVSPARLRKPLKRVGPRGSGEFEEIEWTDALETATAWLKAIRKTDPKTLAFFTGRDQSQSLTGWWAKQFGTPNYAAHGGFLLGEYGRRWIVFDWRVLLGVRGTGLGSCTPFVDVRRRRRP